LSSLRGCAGRRRPGPRRARAWLILIGVGCSPPKGAWRDQWVFVADDGGVLALGVDRAPDGTAEAKGWLGLGGSWGGCFYHRFGVPTADRDDAAAVVRALTASGAAPVRASLDERDGRVEIRLRTPQAALRLVAESTRRLGRTNDPEGETVYDVGRARLRREGVVRDGWLVVERTPRERPHRPAVDYGDFVSVVIANAGRGPVVMKRSLGVRGFDHALVKDGAGRRTTVVRATVARGSLALDLPELGLHMAPKILDRIRSDGHGPDGTPLAYDVLLLGGDGEWAGVAFTIRRARRAAAPLGRPAS